LSKNIHVTTNGGIIPHNLQLTSANLPRVRIAFWRSLAPEAIVPDPGFSCFKIAMNWSVLSPTKRDDPISSKGKEKDREEGGKEGGREGGRDGRTEGRREGRKEGGREEGRSEREGWITLNLDNQKLPI